MSKDVAKGTSLPKPAPPYPIQETLTQLGAQTGQISGLQTFSRAPVLGFAHLICEGGRMSKPKRAALYVRVSTDKQSVENQIRDLRLVAERRGWQVVEIYRDEVSAAPSGATSDRALTPC